MMEVTTKFIKILKGESTDWDILTFQMTQDKLQNTADIFSVGVQELLFLSYLLLYSQLFQGSTLRQICTFKVS